MANAASWLCPAKAFSKRAIDLFPSTARSENAGADRAPPMYKCIYTFSLTYLCPVIFFLTTILALCFLSVLHTYVLYPWLLLRKIPDAGNTRPPTDEAAIWPAVAVLMAAHNEEAVLEEKLETLAQQDYPGALSVFIGSDCSTDRTNAILEEWAAKDSRFRPTLYTNRQGKPGIINQLAQQAPAEVFIITDASVMLKPGTIKELVRPMLEDERIGVVDTTMVQIGGDADGIGQSEQQYINREVALKQAESRRWGAMIGPFGGCWAIRSMAFKPVPDNFLVDDFFLCMAAYEAGWLGVSSSEAIVYEGVGQSIKDEFRRKVRISSGNWQNLVRFRKLWWPPFKSDLAYAFFSHKVLRWWTPFFILTGAIAGALLVVILGNHWASLVLLSLMAVLVSLVVLDLLLAPMGIHFKVLRGLRYFLAMNTALLVGFYRFLTGIKSNVWKPSQRN